MRMKRYLIWILPAAAAVMIFCFSAQPGDESAQLSGRMAQHFAHILARLIPSVDPAVFSETISTLIRKAAHITEYTLFYLTLLAAWHVTGLRRRKRVGAAMLTVFLYACSDEFHQLFVDGRAGLFSDVLIDSSASLAISLLLMLHFS
ncbi:MAG: VanZ family protein, partial [Lachnospiraceae bacterium]|nr:VanZ family protein [Lachnospiraceae bacterium]